MRGKDSARTGSLSGFLGWSSLSSVVGAALPIVLHRNGVDAAHAGPAIQVLMDILGVTITCAICSTAFALFHGDAASPEAGA